MKKRIQISLCMIVLNEEKFLKRSLANVAPYVDEMVIVDGGSTDKTLEIAKGFGARIIRAPWKEDFAAQRNISLKHAKKDWILVIDADEVYEKKLLEELQSLAKNNIGIDAFAFPRKNYIDGKLTSAYPDRQTRLFKRDKKIHYERPLHEMVVGFRRIASPMDLHIIHRKTSLRQASQDTHYESIERTSKPRDYRIIERDSRYHRLFALKAAKEAERVLPLFEEEHPDDVRPRQAIEAIRAWAQGKRRLGMVEVRELSLASHAAARTSKSDAARFAARAAGQAVAVWHVPTHAMAVPWYVCKAMAARKAKARKPSGRFLG